MSVPSTTARWAAGIIVVAIGMSIAFGQLANAPRFTPDGWYYGRLMLEARGVDDAAAITQMDAFYKTTDIGRTEKYRRMFAPNRPATFLALSGLFSSRVLYPRLAALIGPSAGMAALITVSLIAYVVTGIGVYLCTTSFARPWIGVAAAALLYLDPVMQLLARSALCDMTAIAVWSLLLATLCAMPSHHPWRLIAVAVALEIGLMAVRPLIYLPAGATLFAAVAANRQPRRRKCMTLVLGASCIIAVTFIAAGAISGTPGIAESINWLYLRSVELGNTPPETPIWRWYAWSLLRSLEALVPHSVRSVASLLAALSLFVVRGGPTFALFAGAVVGGFAAAPLNPDPNDVERTLIAPLQPVFIAMSALAFERLARMVVPRLQLAWGQRPPLETGRRPFHVRVLNLL